MADPVVKACAVTYGYRRGSPVLQDVDVVLARGTVTALTGPSGTGKSTLLYLLAGMLTPWAGSVLHHGSDLASHTDAQRARLRALHSGFVFQDVALDPGRTILDAVLEPCLYAGESRVAHRARALALLDRVGVSPQSYARPGEVSGGQAQRVGVCRALLLEPDVIFADEPTGNLDHSSADVVLGALEAAAADGTAVVIATHDDRVLARCTHRVSLS